MKKLAILLSVATFAITSCNNASTETPAETPAADTTTAPAAEVTAPADTNTVAATPADTTAKH